MAWLLGRFRYALAGVKNGMLKDRSIRLQLLFGAAAILFSWILKIDRTEWLWILLSVALVLICETFNSCIEKTIDYISLERTVQAGLIKDMAAAAVFCASVFAFVCAIMIWIPHIAELLAAVSV